MLFLSTSYSTSALLLAAILVPEEVVLGFAPSKNFALSQKKQQQSSFLGAVRLKDPPTETETMYISSFDPLGLSSMPERRHSIGEFVDDANNNLLTSSSAALTTVLLLPADKASAIGITMPESMSTSFDPKSFVPICGASDGFYRFLQSSTQAVVGTENFNEYGPLIASGLLRVRLELCVVESFFNEAVGPFIKQNGLSWVLPVHETVETFLAGTVFALATTFILVGSTKLLTVIFTYADFIIGGPLRLIGGFAFDRARGKPVTLDVGFGPFKTRVIGPPLAEGEKNNKEAKMDWSIDMDKTGPADLAVIVISGGVKAVGASVGVR